MIGQMMRLLLIVAGVGLFTTGVFIVGVMAAPRVIGPKAEACICGQPLHCHRKVKPRVAAAASRPAPLRLPRVGRQALAAANTGEATRRDSRPQPIRIRGVIPRPARPEPSPAAPVITEAMDRSDSGETAQMPVVADPDTTAALPTIPESAPMEAAA